MSEQPAVYRGTADARINGVACQVEIVIEPLANGEVAGVSGLPHYHDEPLVGFVLNASKIAFLDLPCDDDAALAAAFGTTAEDIRGCLAKLTVKMLLPNAEEITLPALAGSRRRHQRTRCTEWVLPVAKRMLVADVRHFTRCGTR